MHQNDILKSWSRRLPRPAPTMKTLFLLLCLCFFLLFSALAPVCLNYTNYLIFPSCQSLQRAGIWGRIRCGLLRNSRLSGNLEKVHRQNHSTKLVSSTPEGVSCAHQDRVVTFLGVTQCLERKPFHPISLNSSTSLGAHLVLLFPSLSQSSLSFTFLVYLVKILFLYCPPAPFLFN